MNRAAIWKKPHALMLGSFDFRSVISSERLINACRWFEEIPIARQQNALSDEQIESIATAAAFVAMEQGHSEKLVERIESAIKWVKAESAEERFTRLVAQIEGRFGKGILAERVVDHLRRAIQFRSKAAHGHFSARSEVELRAFSKSTCALEALCFLLMAIDLPIPEAGINRLKSHPLVQGYLLAYE